MSVESKERDDYQERRHTSLDMVQCYSAVIIKQKEDQRPCSNESKAGHAQSYCALPSQRHDV